MDPFVRAAQLVMVPPTKNAKPELLLDTAVQFVALPTTNENPFPPLPKANALVTEKAEKPLDPFSTAVELMTERPDIPVN